MAASHFPEYLAESRDPKAPWAAYQKNRREPATLKQKNRKRQWIKSPHPTLSGELKLRVTGFRILASVLPRGALCLS